MSVRPTRSGAGWFDRKQAPHDLDDHRHVDCGHVHRVARQGCRPGDHDHIPLWLTIICGIGGCLLGSYLYAALFDCSDMNNCTNGVDWWRHVWQIAVAAILVMVAAGVTGRSKKPVI